ncbi:cytochrome P450 [Kribbella sp. NPDC051770]|uniref:cytochrome P450 n=1 Tax=Kribbella sp. NPDC051770 TaxID=3155413 RepID=UPI00341E26DC
MPSQLPTASVVDSARAVRDILLPVAAQGAIVRRPLWSQLADRFAADDRSLRRARALRRKYGEGPILLRIPGRSLALVLAPADVHRVLAETPDPFSAATTEKTGALAHFQPHGVLITDPPLRAPRRELNEQALDTHQPVHRHADRMLTAITEEFSTLHGTLGWTDFREIWSRAVRRIVLGEVARDDTLLSQHLDALRADANWAEFRPRNTRRRDQFHQQLAPYVEHPAPGSLVSALPTLPPDGLDPAGQVPHWLFAFDAAGIALWRLLAVLAARPDLLTTVVAEAEHPDRSPLLAYTGAAVQESLRLWPTTLVLLRETARPTTWNAATAPANTEFAIVSSIFHRDDQAIDYADQFTPEIWLDGRADGDWPLLPFSEGPAVCPGRNVVLLTTSAATCHLAQHHNLDVDPTTREALTRPALPKTLDHTRIRLGFWPR